MSTSPDHQNASPSATAFNNNGRPLRYPVLDDKEHALIAVAVLVPVAVAFILCLVTYCLYRHKKRRAQRNASRRLIDQPHTVVSAISHKPIMMEGLPPSYEETKTDLPFTPKNNNTYEQVQVSTKKNENSVAPSAPPPLYPNVSNQSKRQFSEI